MTPEIERIQNEIGLNLINVVPVPWTKIAFRAMCNDSYCDIYYAFEEAETHIVSSMDNRSLRFKTEWYKIDPNKTKIELLKLPIDLYKAYKKLNTNSAMWNSFTYVLDNSGHFNIDFEYETDKGNALNRVQWRKKYLDEKPVCYYRGLYPDTSDYKIIE